MRKLFSEWDDVAVQLKRARTIALFLDFDGTLAQLERRPDEVTLDKSVRRYLHQLAASPKFRLWVISGRRQADIATRIRVPGIRYLGLHGWEGRQSGRWTGRGSGELPSATLDALALVKRQIRARFGGEQVWIEDKHASVAFHYRGSTVRGALLHSLHEAVRPLQALLQMKRAKNVFEAMAREIEDKGEAVRHQMSTIRNATLPLYVGDDFIDEPAFRALPYGITVHVGRMRQTRAKYWLPSVREVHRLLERLAVEFA